MNETLKDPRCNLDFPEIEGMKDFLHDMEESDTEATVKLNTMKVSVKDEKEGSLLVTAEDTDGENFETEAHNFTLRTLEKRSGCDASGNENLTLEQEAECMSTFYFPNQPDKKVCTIKMRGGVAIGFGSKQYETISQKGMLDTSTEWLDKNHPNGWIFKGGSYSHQLTEAKFEITDAISPAYKSAWKKTGLPQSLLDQSHITVQVLTDDTAECAAKAIICMNVGGTNFLLGNPIEIQHRAGYGGLESFATELDKVDISIKDELDALANLMGINLLHPANAGITALKKAKIDKISKKACKELVEDMLFGSTESAYIVYLFLHGITGTPNGSKLSEERQLRVITALRTLLKEDWKKMDVPSASL
jgi:hypothetical protein